MAGVIGRVAPWRQTAWDWRAAGNLIGGGSGTGLLVVAAIAAGPTYPVQALLGMGLVGAGLLCVWAEIGRPWRAFNVFRHARTSWMTREALLAPLLFAAGLSAVVSGSRWLAWVTAAFALAYLYCQARMLHAGRGIPAWRHGYVIALMMITGMTEGAGWCVLLQATLDARAMPPWHSRSMPEWLSWLLVVLLIARTGVFAGYRTALARSGAPRNTLAVLERVKLPLTLFDLAAAMAVVAGTVLLTEAELLGRPGVDMRSWIGPLSSIPAAAGLLAVLSGWWLKFTIVVRAAFNQGFALPRMPDRGSGSIGPAVKPGW